MSGVSGMSWLSGFRWVVAKTMATLGLQVSDEKLQLQRQVTALQKEKQTLAKFVPGKSDSGTSAMRKDLEEKDKEIARYRKRLEEGQSSYVAVRHFDALLRAVVKIVRLKAICFDPFY